MPYLFISVVSEGEGVQVFWFDMLPVTVLRTILRNFSLLPVDARAI